MGGAVNKVKSAASGAPNWMKGAGAGLAMGGPGMMLAGAAAGGLKGDDIWSALKGDPGGLDKHGEYAFHDPTGSFDQAMDAAQSMQGFGQQQLSERMDPEAFMNRFQADAQGAANVAFGHGSPVQQQLNALAARQSQQGLDMASNEMAGMGALHSGAASRAMGEAMANPFAQVQAQMGQQQLGMFGDFMNQAAGRQNLEAQLASQLWGQGAGLMGQLGQSASALEAPVYTERGPSGGLSSILGGGMAGATGGAAFGTPGAIIGGGLGALSGILGA